MHEDKSIFFKVVNTTNVEINIVGKHEIWREELYQLYKSTHVQRR